MRPLEEASRRIVVLWSVALCVGSLLLAPLVARSSIDLNAQQELAMHNLQLPDVKQLSEPAKIAVSRDPFTADAPPGIDMIGPLGAGAVPIGGSVVGRAVHAGDALGIVLPPNGGAAGSIPLAAGRSTVSAIITGERAQALVYEGDRSRIISVGEILEGHRVTSIGSAGVQLDDGSMRRLSEDHL
ncbi:MAG: hypothetical protein GIW97_06780 [Candidatus Eremiobacteraeota bacterium]|nr:hypothetical protein [Candidatus Eremiobacteraeota bacterium]